MAHGSDIGSGRRRMLVGLAFTVLLIAACFLASLQPLDTQPANAQYSPEVVGPPHFANAAPAPPCPPAWGIVDSPNPSTSTNYLFGIDAVSSSDVWAVGSFNLGGGSRTFTLHWDGNVWSQVPSPSPGTTTDTFNDVEAVTSNDVWAVGVTYGGYGGARRTLIEHWDGTQWTQVPSPSPDIAENYLLSVSAVSANDVWAVGYYSSGSWYRTLVEHWDGTQWSIVPSPNMGTSHNTLYSVSAVSANDVWAVGYSSGVVALIEHWDGVQWSIIPNPNPPGTQLSTLEGISALAANDVWAVGRWADATIDHTLVKHWDGVQWSVVPSPDVVPRTNWLYDVSAFSPTDVWAVGYYCCGGSGAGTLAMHWDGVQWSIVPSPNGTGNNYFKAVAAVSSSDVWAVGHFGGSAWYTLIEHYSLTDACLTPSPTYTATVTPTFTRTSTSTRTPTYTRTPSFTITPSSTPTFETRLIGHVNWESRPSQPNQLQEVPVTLTLVLQVNKRSYPIELTDQTTDPYGFFTVTLDNLPNSIYNWYVDDTYSAQHSPNYLSNSGTVTLTGEPVINVEMGMVRAGDATNDNLVNISDFNILKASFNLACRNPNYDNRADFTGDCVVSISDFVPLKANFGQSGAP